MWRFQGFVGRVLHRYHGSNTLRLPQNHHVEDEVINSSAVLSTSPYPSDSRSREEEDGERRRKRRTFQSQYAEFPRYTALDAVGWGAAAVLFMQVCRRIHSQFSSNTEPSPTTGALSASSTLQKCGYRILLEILSRHDVLPRGRNVLCLQGVLERQNQDQSPAQSSDSSSSSNSPQSSRRHDHHTAISDPQRELLIQDLLTLEEELLSASCPLQDDASQDDPENTDASDEEMLSDEERLATAAQKLRHVEHESVPVILNVIGLENAKRKHYQEAFTCFLAAAQQGYSKSQFNVGVCYETGRGVSKNTEKALYYYRQAAVSGHRQAQYRYAKLLLTSRGHQSSEELTTAIDLLEQAAAAGLTKAQLCLASVYAQDSVKYGCKSIQYLEMAAESGDDTALLFLGNCYERGFVVQHNLRTAIQFYKQAAKAGNKQAKRLLRPPNETYTKESVLRSIHSAPCFSKTVSSLPSCVPPCSSQPTVLPPLPHSWSTGNLCWLPSLSSAPLHLHSPSDERRTCQWTVGVG
ncbi:death ligand signal enhancer isoform X2 [Archocentrus centrarchus]|uniref:death ligand signal enhancer isoform X2 n=1 Tax=Archocentrus centrarchus TaxID=63155 RepID=UPI0011E9F1AB|nr:death ligand signal enhancer isoform X2 [Archocentrus centrarchus]